MGLLSLREREQAGSRSLPFVEAKQLPRLPVLMAGDDVPRRPRSADRGRPGATAVAVTSRTCVSRTANLPGLARAAPRKQARLHQRG